MEREIGGWRRRGRAGTLPEHSAHLLCISEPIQTYNMLKWHLHLCLKVAAFCKGEISEDHMWGPLFFFYIWTVSCHCLPGMAKQKNALRLHPNLVSCSQAISLTPQWRETLRFKSNEILTFCLGVIGNCTQLPEMLISTPSNTRLTPPTVFLQKSKIE